MCQLHQQILLYLLQFHHCLKYDTNHLRPKTKIKIIHFFAVDFENFIIFVLVFQLGAIPFGNFEKSEYVLSRIAWNVADFLCGFVIDDVTILFVCDVIILKPNTTTSTTHVYCLTRLTYPHRQGFLTWEDQFCWIPSCWAQNNHKLLQSHPNGTVFFAIFVSHSLRHWAFFTKNVN